MFACGLRATITAVGLAAVVAAGTGCDEESSEEPSEEATNRKQAQKGAASAGSETADDEKRGAMATGDGEEGEPSGKPGWEIELSGPVSAEIDGPSVLRKRAGVETRQIVLAGLPTQSTGPDNRMAISLSAFDEKGAKTYGASGAEAYFGSVKMTCRHPAEGKGEKRSKLRVEVTAVSESRLAGTFEGILQCKRVREDEDEEKPKPVFVEVSGRFLDV